MLPFCRVIFFALISFALAQFPTIPADLTTIKSLADSDVTISFKETDICERTPGVKTYSGYVNLPGSSLSDIGGYDIHTYFIYFEARHNPSTAPLGIYLAGGPGESSIYAALSSESGPCYVNIDATDTISNPWSFNNHVNMLYIDQPVQAGYSYDELVSATFNFTGPITPIDIDQYSLPPVTAAFGYGTYPSQKFHRTANNTVQAAKALWHFAENWLSSFPGYDSESNEIGIWGNSYGGYWVPETAAQLSKNLKNLPAEHPLKAKNLVVDNIGITNGCVDFESSIIAYPEFAYNNTYGVQFGSEALYEESLHNLTKPGGCQDLMKLCRAAGELGDPEYTGANHTVNEICMQAFGFCELYVIGAFPKLFYGTNNFDIAIPAPDPCPHYLPVDWYLNTASVQQALGVPLNFTYDSSVVTSNFGLPSIYDGTRPLSASTGDAVRQNGLPNIEYLLGNGVKVAFVFGDRDFRCPWTGGELTALAAKWEHQTDFASAGYEELQGIVTPVDQGGHGAVVKQYGQFSFSRVLDSGHAVSAYAPETVYRIFQRTVEGVDVVSGKESIEGGYHTEGPKSSFGFKNTLPMELPATCMVEGQFQKRNPWAAVLAAAG